MLLNCKHGFGFLDRIQSGTTQSCRSVFSSRKLRHTLGPSHKPLKRQIFVPFFIVRQCINTQNRKRQGSILLSLKKQQGRVSSKRFLKYKTLVPRPMVWKACKSQHRAGLKAPSLSPELGQSQQPLHHQQSTQQSANQGKTMGLPHLENRTAHRVSKSSLLHPGFLPSGLQLRKRSSVPLHSDSLPTCPGPDVFIFGLSHLRP